MVIVGDTRATGARTRLHDSTKCHNLLVRTPCSHRRTTQLRTPQFASLLYIINLSSVLLSQTRPPSFVENRLRTYAFNREPYWLTTSSKSRAVLLSCSLLCTKAHLPGATVLAQNWTHRLTKKKTGPTAPLPKFIVVSSRSCLLPYAFTLLSLFFFFPFQFRAYLVYPFFFSKPSPTFFLYYILVLF